MDVNLAYTIMVSIIFGILAFIISGASRRFESDPNINDLGFGIVGVQVGLCLCLCISLFVVEDTPAKNPHVRVIELGVVDKIDPLTFVWGDVRIVQFERRIHEDTTRTKSIILEDSDGVLNAWYKVPQERYERMQKQFVAGKEYIMTCQQVDGDDVVLSFYPKGI